MSSRSENTEPVSTVLRAFSIPVLPSLLTTTPFPLHLLIPSQPPSLPHPHNLPTLPSEMKDSSFCSPLRSWHSSSAIPLNLCPPFTLTSWYPLYPSDSHLPPQTAKIKDNGEKGRSRSTRFVPYAIPFNTSHSSPFTFLYYPLNSFSPFKASKVRN